MFKKVLGIVGASIVLMVLGIISFPMTGIAAVAGTEVPELANGGGVQGCSFQGSWFGYTPAGNAEWLITVQGQSSSGTNNLEDTTVDPTLGGMYPNAVRTTTLRGTWERTGSNTFRYSMVGFAVDKNGATVWIAKLSGTNKLINDCNKEYITSTLEVFLPNQNPFVDEAQLVIPLGDHYGYRMQ